MKKIALLIIMLLGLNHVHAQYKAQVHYKKWSYGLFVAGTTNYRRIRSTNEEDWLKRDKDNDEIRRTSITAGFIANYLITDKFSLNTGLVYSDLGYKTRPETLRFSDNAFTKASVTVHYNYVIIPLDLKYNFLKHNKWNLYLAGGVSPAVFIGQNRTVSYNDVKNSDSESVGRDRFNFIADLQAGLDYSLSDRFKLTGGLFYKQFLNATNSNLPTKEMLNSAGISVGVIYLHKK